MCSSKGILLFSEITGESNQLLTDQLKPANFLRRFEVSPDFFHEAEGGPVSEFSH